MKAPVRKRRGFPLVPTLMVLLALPLLFSFGFWQLERKAWKEALLDDLRRNAEAPVVAIADGRIPDDFQFRSVRMGVRCAEQQPLVKAGRSTGGQSGYSVFLDCAAADTPIRLNIGWGPRSDSWKDARLPGPEAGAIPVEGVLVEAGGSGPQWTLVTRDAPAPLKQSAPPTTETLPNNHLSYAIQWFSFAAILATIYLLYLRRWRQAGRARLAPGDGQV